MMAVGPRLGTLAAVQCVPVGHTCPTIFLRPQSDVLVAALATPRRRLQCDDPHNRRANGPQRWASAPYRFGKPAIQLNTTVMMVEVVSSVRVLTTNRRPSGDTS